MEIVKAKSVKENDVYIVDGFLFRIKSRKNENIYYVCFKEVFKARDVLRGNGKFIVIKPNEGHGPDCAHNQILEARATIHKRIREEVTALVAIILREESQKFIDKGLDLVTKVPKYHNVKKHLLEIRRQSSGFYRNPSFADTYDGQPFLILDTVNPVTEGGILVFLYERALRALFCCETVLGDGIFKPCKANFFIHGVVRESSDPSEIQIVVPWFFASF
ncbi:hypothetical protein QYM36_003464 [Artemia franciscana]|uniref:Uncharacterized protein n=1 Tax=Artemia franciscana TaxID=6661 RepID=A0AA88LDU1_ARTSF|nr:hypothetical protein QYM36_003464 [Artemia franciscana]